MGYRIKLNNESRKILAKLIETGTKYSQIFPIEDQDKIKALAKDVIIALEDTNEYIIILDE